MEVEAKYLTLLINKTTVSIILLTHSLSWINTCKDLQCAPWIRFISFPDQRIQLSLDLTDTYTKGLPTNTLDKLYLRPAKIYS